MIYYGGRGKVAKVSEPSVNVVVGEVQGADFDSRSAFVETNLICTAKAEKIRLRRRAAPDNSAELLRSRNKHSCDAEHYSGRAGAIIVGSAGGVPDSARAAKGNPEGNPSIVSHA